MIAHRRFSLCAGFRVQSQSGMVPSRGNQKVPSRY